MAETLEDVSEKPKAKRGKPPQSEVTPEAQSAKAFPLPPKSTFKDGTIPPEKFWGYRSALPPEFLPRLSFYVYREWPVLDLYRQFTDEQLAEIKAHKRKKPVKYIAQYPDIPHDDWRNFLLERHGSGVYKILLNDSGVRGNPKLERGNVCQVIVDCRDEHIDPIIDDLNILDIKDPANTRYMTELRIKGIEIPGDLSPLKKQEDNNDMATNIAVEKLADALVEQTKSKPPVDNGAAVMLSDLLKQSETRHLKELEMAEARHQRDIEALTKRLESAEKVSSSAPTTTQQVIEMARAIAPPPAPPAPAQDNKMVDLLMQMLQNDKSARIEELKMLDARHAREMEALTKRLEAMDARERDRIAKLEATPPAAAPAQSSVFKEVIGALEGLNRLKDKMSSDESGGTGNPYVDLATELGPKILDTITTVATSIRGPLAPLPPANPVSVPAIQSQQQPQEQSEMNMMATYLRGIKNPLFDAMRNQVPGFRFAGQIIASYGEGAYQQLTGQGEPGLISFLGSAPEIWGEMQRTFGPQKIQQFVTEFLNSNAAMEQAVAIRQQQQGPPAATPPVATAHPSPGAGARPPQQQRPAPVVVDAAAPPVANPSATGRREVIGPDGKAVNVVRPNGTTEAT